MVRGIELNEGPELLPPWEAPCVWMKYDSGWCWIVALNRIVNADADVIHGDNHCEWSCYLLSRENETFLIVVIGEIRCE